MAVRPIGDSTRSPSTLPALSAGVTASAVLIGALSISFATAEALALSERAVATWIMVQFGIPGLLGLVLAGIYRQPLLLIPNTTSIIFFGSLAGQIPWSAIVGSAIVAGLVLTVLGVFRLTSRLATVVPAPIILGVVGGAVLPFVLNLFGSLQAHPVLIGGMITAFLLGPRLTGSRIPSIVFALVLGLIIIIVSGDVQRPTDAWAITTPQLVSPTITLPALVTIVPVIVTLVALQANLSSIVYLRNEGYRTPDRVIDIAGGASTAAASIFGPVPVSLAGFVTPIVGGPEAGDRRLRHVSIYVVGVVAIAIAAAGALAMDARAMVPEAFLLALVGLATLAVLQQALTEITRGPIRLGPLIAFVVALSDLTLFDLGPLFWSLVLGLTVTLLVESREYRANRVTT